MANTHRMHWLAPSTVLFSLTAGVLFALGHHLFYASLAGKEVHNDDLDVLGTQVSEQQFNITVGTIFSYLVNFFLGTAIATAYAQLFWRSLLKSHATLETWDAAFSANSNLFFLGKVWIWWKYPLLFAVLGVAWLLPLASTIPPGTLSVGTARVDPPQTVRQQVPMVDFASLNYVGRMPHDGSGAEDSTVLTMYDYNGPSIDVSRIASQVAQTGELLPIKAPYLNASWTMDFPGPGLKCKAVPESVQATVKQRLKDSEYCGADGVQGYMAWDNQSPIELSKGNTIAFKDFSDEGLAINVVSLPHMMDLEPNTNDLWSQYFGYTKACYSGSKGLNDPERFADSIMIQCQLLNVTYHVTFEYTNGDQNITHTTSVIDENPIKRINQVHGRGTQASDYVLKDGMDCSILSGWPDYSGQPYCKVDETVLKTLSYQSIFDAFYNLVKGTVSRSEAGTAPTINTSVTETVLVRTKELNFLEPSFESYQDYKSMPLQDYILSKPIGAYEGLVNTARTGESAGLIDSIEKLFEGITVSMMSSKVLQPNATSKFQPQPVTVTLNNIHNVYVYASQRLWVAYGIAVGFAVVTSAVGIWALIANGVSYSQDFSTVFRIARGASISEAVQPDDVDGKDPLPKYLKKSKIWLASLNTNGTEKTTSLQSNDGSQSDGDDGEETALSPTTVERTAGT